MQKRKINYKKKRKIKKLNKSRNKYLLPCFFLFDVANLLGDQTCSGVDLDLLGEVSVALGRCSGARGGSCLLGEVSVALEVPGSALGGQRCSGEGSCPGEELLRGGKLLWGGSCSGKLWPNVARGGSCSGSKLLGSCSGESCYGQ